MASNDALKLVSINIELDRHFDTVFPFLEKEHPDVVCLQELLERDVELFKNKLGMKGVFAAGCVLDLEMSEDNTLVHSDRMISKGPEGIALLTRLPVLSSHRDYYRGGPDEAPFWSHGQNRLLLSATVKKGETEYTLATTHFTWTPDGQASAEQRKDMESLLKILARFQDMVFCGDFNAPRGLETWAELSKNYKDNIPSEYRSSLDPKLHRAGHLDRMVDGLFSTPTYEVSEVRLIEGVSDHKAVVGFIERV